jgi:site-specific recombinase XerD
MIRWLIKTNEIKDDPFAKVDPVARTKTNQKTKLTFEQIEAIKNLQLKQGSDLWHVRNYFMYSFYNAGIRFGDLCCLTWENIIDGRLIYEMNKTGSRKSIQQMEPMRQILDLYRTDDCTGYIFPILQKDFTDPGELRKRISSNNVIVNRHLKAIAKKAGIQANISFHVSRHSFANYALKKGMDLYSISKALGHSDLKITEEYINSFDEELLDKSMDKLWK